MPGHRRAALAAVLALTACDQPGRDGGSMAQDADDTPVATGEPAQTQGLDSALVARAFARADSLPRLYSLLVARHGELLHEQYYNGRDADDLANIKSASKSIISALVGIAISEGLLDGLDQPVAPLFTAEIREPADPRLARVTVEHLLSMQSGLQSTSFDNYGQWVSSRNWVSGALNRPFADEPGGRMLYSTGSTHLLSALLTRATGVSTHAWARDRLFRPLGIELRPWTTDPQGVYFGGNEMRLRPRELLAFGELYRNGGRVDTLQLVPPGWIEESWTRRTTSPYNGHGYGLGWWIRRYGGFDVYFAWGYGGQYVFVVPELELTVVTTSDPVSPREGSHNRELHRLLSDYFIPAAAAGALSP